MSNVTNSSGSADTSFDNLYPAIAECFVIILCGYVAGRMNLISPTESKGLNTFVGHFSLPALIFLAMATLDFAVVDWMFLLSICVAKTLVFVAVVLVALAVSRPVDLGKAGIYGIFCTQSNDFALGFPIVAALYHESHPEYPGYLYLLAPISLVFLNPVGFVLMEIQKRRRLCTGESSTGRGQVALHIARDVLGNPIVLMTIAGIIGNFAFQHCLPVILEGVLSALGSAFSATALFCLGLKMVGQMKNLSGKTLVVPGILIAVKLLVLPLVARECVNLFRAGVAPNDTLSLSTYGFLYGTFPTAPGVFVYASQYNLDVDLIATAMVACTFFSAPLMFVSAKMVMLHVAKESDYLPDLTKFLFNVGIVGIVVCVWTIAVFVLSKRWRRMPHCITLCLVLSQLIACVGALVFSQLEWNHSWQFHIQFLVLTFGVLSSRIWTALLALTMLLLRWRGLCFALRIRPALALVGWGLPAVLVTILCLVVRPDTAVKERVDPNFQYGRTQATITCLVLLGSFVVTVVSLILHQRSESRHPATSRSIGSEYQSLLRDSGEGTDEETTNCTVGINNDRTIAANGISGRPPADQFTVCRGSGCRLKKEDQDSACCLQDVEDINFMSEEEEVGVLTPAASNARETEHLCSSQYGCSSVQRHQCTTIVREYESLTEPDEPELMVAGRKEDKSQLLRHVVLLLMLLVSMLVFWQCDTTSFADLSLQHHQGFALCMWKLIMEETSGIYVELEFLDGALNFGQGLFVFAVFGLDGKLILQPFIRRWRKFWYGQEAIVLPAFRDLPQETLKICEQFRMFHYRTCVKDLIRDRIWRLKHFRSVFCGNELVDWLMLIGLVHDRTEAVTYGRHLLNGRVIRHAENQHHFQDSAYFYVLVASETQPPPLLDD